MFQKTAEGLVLERLGSSNWEAELFEKHRQADRVAELLMRNQQDHSYFSGAIPTRQNSRIMTLLTLSATTQAFTQPVALPIRLHVPLELKPGINQTMQLTPSRQENRRMVDRRSKIVLTLAFGSWD